MITITYIGHSTTLIKIGGVSFLTDPNFGKRVFIFPRVTPLPMAPSALPPVTAILLSHTHIDHLNISSFKFLSCSIPIIVPEGCERAVGKFVPNPIIELSHYAEHELVDGTIITAVPVSHISGRVSHLKYTRANAYLISSADKKECVFFCGDSAYSEKFREAGNLRHIDVALLPIGSYEPRSIMHRSHMNPAEAVQAFEDLKASHMIPIHHGTFRLSLESPTAPAKWIEKIITDRSDLAAKVHLLKAGEQFQV